MDLTNSDDEPFVIRRPTDIPTFSTPARGVVPVNRSTQQGPLVDTSRRPPMFMNGKPQNIYNTAGARPGQTGTYYAGEHLDATRTTESLKELLEGMNISPIVKRGKKKKNKKAGKTDLKLEETILPPADPNNILEQVDDELAALIGGADLTDKKDDAVKSPEAEAEVDEEEEEEEEDDEEDEDNVIEGLNVNLLPHQVHGVRWLLSREEGKARGGILADDMGLGKTIQSLALILSHPHPKYPFTDDARQVPMSPTTKKKVQEYPPDQARGTLVVAPLSLIRQWEGEIEKRTEDTHNLKVLVHHGPKRTTDPRVLRKYDIVITTYDIIRSEHGKATPVGCFGVRWWRIICDEAHTIKNRTSKMTQASYDLLARYRWALTGTPMQNNLDELQSLFKFLRIPPFDDIGVWKEQISRPMQQNKGGIAIDRLRVVLGAVMMRRTKDVLKAKAKEEGKDSGLDLGARTMVKTATNFNEIEREFYDKLEARTEESLEKMMSGFGKTDGKVGNVNMSALVLLLRLRQACNHPHLLKAKLAKDKDSGMGLATPRKQPKRVDDSVQDDDLADLMGGLSVDQRKCDICLTALSRMEIDDGAVRCADCNSDLKGIGKGKKTEKKHKSSRSSKPKPPATPVRRRRVVLDSDDEDDSEPEVSEANTTAGSQAEESDTPESDEDSPRRPRSDAYDSSSDFEETTSDLRPSTKIAELLKILRVELKQKNKTIVFSQFTSMLDLIEPFLRAEGVEFTRYDGSMKNDDREASLNKFKGEKEYAPRPGKEDKDWCGVLLCSLKCGALGLNLIAACRVVLLEPFWNPFIEEQAIDRVHRFGQTKDVIVYKLLVENSVEERIIQLQDRKRELSKAALGEGAESEKAKTAKLSMKDIMYLFKRDAEGHAKDLPGVGQKTRILKETRLPEGNWAPKEGRYSGTQEQEEQERRREKERQSVFSRR